MASGPPDPTHFADGSPVPRNTGPQTPPGTGGGPGTSGFTQDQMNAWNAAVRSNPDLSGVWDTIQSSVGDAWGWLKDHFGDINWGDLGNWLKSNAGAITQAALTAANAVNQYQRQQKSDQYAQQALKLAQSSYDAKAPLRAAGQAGMLDPHASTPNLSNLSAQGQHGSSIQAPLPLAAPQTAYQNAGSVSGNNPFTKGLPMAPAPVSSAPPMGPGGPTVPGQPPGGFKPYQPLPLGPGGGTGPLPPTVSLPPQSGPIKAGPKDRPLPMGTMPVPPNQPLPKTVPHYTSFAPGS